MPREPKTKTVVVRPVYFILAAVAIIIALASFWAYHRAHPPPIQFRSETAVPYQWTVLFRCDNGRHPRSVSGTAAGYETQLVPWPQECEGDRVLMDVIYISTQSDCVGGSTNRYMTPYSQPLTFRINCAKSGAHVYRHSWF